MQALKQLLKHLFLQEATRFKRETGQDVITPQERLLKYAQERGGGYFVHFSNLPKMALFLQNKFNTPIGFYAYPFKVAKFKNFAINRPYRIIFKPKPTAKILDLKKYTEEDLERDLVKLSRDPVAISTVEERGHNFRHWIDMTKRVARVRTPGGYIWAITRMLSGADKAEEFLKKVGKVGPGPDPKNPKPVGEQDLPRKGGGPTGTWTMMFRRLGYDGVVDSAGEGIIHPAERYQGVFFNTTALDLVEIIEKKKSQYVSGKNDLFKVTLANRKLNGRDFSGRSLAGAVFTGSELKGANFSGATLTDAVFRSTNLSGANLTKASMKKADLTQVFAAQANLEGAVLDEVAAYGADFTEASLSKASFRNAHCEGATFNRADLRGAFLAQVTLAFCKFRGADLRGANLAASNLSAADFTDANLEGVNLLGAAYTNSTKFPEGFDPVAADMTKYAI